MLAYLYDEHVGPSVSRWRRRPRLEYPEERYLLHSLADAVEVMRFAQRHAGSLNPRSIHAHASRIADAGDRVAELDDQTGLAGVLADHVELIASELTAGDLPPHDLEFLAESGSRDPETELNLAVERLRMTARSPLNADERGLQRTAVGVATREVRRVEEELPLEESGSRTGPPDRPPRRPFKGLGGIGKGFGLVVADALAIADWPVATPEAAKAGAMASFALGWDGIMSGIGDIRGE